MLSELRHYFEQRGQASLADLAAHFDTPPDALCGMLDVWIRKGRLQKQAVSCGSQCKGCASSATELYVWQDTRTGALEVPLRHCARD